MRINKQVMKNLPGSAGLLSMLLCLGGSGNTPQIFVVNDSQIRLVQNWITLENNDERNHFNSPEGLAVDSAGRIYVADTTNNRIVRIDDITGKNWTTFGTLGSGPNQFRSPQDLAVDSAGRIYVADGNRRIVRIDDMTGKNWTTFGTLGSGPNQFYLIRGIAVDTSGRIYVVDADNNRIVRMDDMTGKNWTTLGGLSLQGGGPGRFFSPQGIAVDPAGRIYVVDGLRIVRMDDMTGKNWATFGTPAVRPLYLPPSGWVSLFNSFPSLSCSPCQPTNWPIAEWRIFRIYFQLKC